MQPSKEKRISRRQVSDSNAKEFVALYNRRDLILYALAVSFGSDAEKRELKYLYEDHEKFVAVPTFCLALTFWANHNKDSGNSYELPLFPPLTVQASGSIPKEQLRASGETDDHSKYPVLHMWQSIAWHIHHLPTPGKNCPVSTRLKCRTLSVLPKSIGTFVTSETRIDQESTNRPLCTLQSTMLILGMPKENVIPMNQAAAVKGSNDFDKIVLDNTPDFEWTYTTTPTQALFYRLASGDSNALHVLGDKTMSASLGLNEKAPILHGLCTFGITVRAILKYVNDDTASLSRLEGRFTAPVFIEDTLRVKLWESIRRKNDRIFDFVVINETTGEKVIDIGCATICDTSWSRL